MGHPGCWGWWRAALEVVAEATFKAAAVVCGIGDQKERRAEDAALAGDVGVVDEVGGADVGGQGLGMVGFGVAGEGKDVLDVGVEMIVPGEAGDVAGEGAGAAGRDEVAERGGDGSGLAWGGKAGAIVEVAVAVVVHAGGDVERGVSIAVVVGAEDDLAGEGEVEVGKVLPEGVSGFKRVLAGVGGGGLRVEEGVVVGVGEDVDADGSDEEGGELELLVADAGELDVSGGVRGAL
jgi:hypothetical protein